MPAPLTPASMITNGRAEPDDERTLERAEQFDQRRFEQRLRIAFSAGGFPPRGEVVQQMLRGGDAHVRGDERGLELVQRLGVELAAGEHAAKRTGELFARPREARGEPFRPGAAVLDTGFSLEEVEHGDAERRTPIAPSAMTGVYLPPDGAADHNAHP